MQSCYDTWTNTPTGLAPETWRWIEKQEELNEFTKKRQSTIRKNGFLARDTKYDLRPGKFCVAHVYIYYAFVFIIGPYNFLCTCIETIESLFYFYRVTGDKTYQVS